MFSNKNIFTLMVGTFLYAGVVTAQSEIDYNLLKLLARSRDFNLDCYLNYISESQEIAEKYKLNNEACSSEADKQRKNADLETLESRQDLANRTDSHCESIAQCKNSSAVNVEYECYRDLGNENYKAFQNISNEASSELAIYMKKTSAIRFNENICTEKSKTIFNNENIEVTEKLNDCLKGNGWATKPTPTVEPITTPIWPTESADKTTTTESS